MCIRDRLGLATYLLKPSMENSPSLKFTFSYLQFYYIFIKVNLSLYLSFSEFVAVMRHEKPLRNWKKHKKARPYKVGIAPYDPP